MKTRHILLLILSITILTACGPQMGELKREDLMVIGSLESISHPVLVLKVDADEKHLLVDADKNPLCDESERKGCLYIRRGRQANIEFKLDDADITANWVFSEFSICKGKTKPDPTKTCKAIRAERREFDASVSKESDKLVHVNEFGIIDLTELGSSLTSFILHDQNSTRQDYFYNIEACKTGTTPLKCVKLDPVMRNKGR